ncbi:hypothetical protein [Paenibacillus larvae]|uniref:hypothetical protein n=1 Tax=Paenibacillus larvae TaxID=1464 RepID=UPI00288FB08C|nr:hypothetical protein [Paenibacillus larvae]MDT2194859.1 hypothetical protein [Paenibacillus larvae]
MATVWLRIKKRIKTLYRGSYFYCQKNGKSGLASGISIYGCTKDGERGADVYVLANSMKQVRKTIFDEQEND